MKWQGRRGSKNIEDRRQSGGARKAGGIGGIAGVLILLAGLYFGFDTLALLIWAEPGSSPAVVT